MANDVEAIVNGTESPLPPPTYSEAIAKADQKDQSLRPRGNSASYSQAGRSQQTTSSAAGQQPLITAPGSPPGSPHRGASRYGPTPMNGPPHGTGPTPVYFGQGVVPVGAQGSLPMPFYHPNSLHSLEMAHARARRRFFEVGCASFWA